MRLEDAYAACARLAQSHYENFPVASRLLPGRMRPHVAAVYAFARVADDIADEGEVDVACRHARLDEWTRRLHASVAGTTSTPGRPRSIPRRASWRRPSSRRPPHTIRSIDLPIDLFDDLVSAFRQDITVTSYDSWGEPVRLLPPIGKSRWAGSCCGSAAGDPRISTPRRTPSAPRCSSRTSGRTWRSTGVAAGCTCPPSSISARARRSTRSIAES